MPVEPIARVLLPPPSATYSTLTITSSLVFAVGAALTGLTSLALSTFLDAATIYVTTLYATTIGSATSLVSAIYATGGFFTTLQAFNFTTNQISIGLGSWSVNSGASTTTLRTTSLITTTIESALGAVSSVGSSTQRFVSGYFNAFDVTSLTAQTINTDDLYVNAIAVSTGILPYSTGVQTIGGPILQFLEAWAYRIYTRTLTITNSVNNVSRDLVTTLNTTSPYTQNVYQIGVTSDPCIVYGARCGIDVYTTSNWGIAGVPGTYYNLFQISTATSTKYGLDCGNFDKTNGRFTPTYSGLYTINFTYILTTTTATATVYLESSSLGLYCLGDIGTVPSGSFGNITNQLVWTGYLSAGSYVFLKCNFPVSGSFTFLTSGPTFTRLSIWRT